MLSGLGAGRNSPSLPKRRICGRCSRRWRRLSDFSVFYITLVTQRAGGPHACLLHRIHTFGSNSPGSLLVQRASDGVLVHRTGRLSQTAIAPFALEAVKRIDAIFEIEREINGLSAEKRLAVRRERVASLVEDLEAWMRTERARLSRHSEVAKAMDYMLKRWSAFARFLDDGRICLTNNCAERELRGVALGRKSWLFAGSDRGGEWAAAMYTLIRPPSSTVPIRKPGSPTCWRASTITRSPTSQRCCRGDGRPINRPANAQPDLRSRAISTHGSHQTHTFEAERHAHYH